MTRASPQDFQEGNETTSTNSGSVSLTASEEKKEETPLAHPTMMAVLRTNPREFHVSQNTSEPAMRTISTESTASPPSAEDHVDTESLAAFPALSSAASDGVSTTDKKRDEDNTPQKDNTTTDVARLVAKSDGNGSPQNSTVEPESAQNSEQEGSSDHAAAAKSEEEPTENMSSVAETDAPSTERAAAHDDSASSAPSQPTEAAAPAASAPQDPAYAAAASPNDGRSAPNEANDNADPTKPQARPRRKSAQLKPGQSAGRWTRDEHQAFLEGLKIFGREWKKVADRIPTRTSAQIRSHAQKYFAKLAREESVALQPEPAAANLHQYHLAYDPNNAVPRDTSSSSSPHHQPVPPRVQRNVQRIMANPSGAQREVEDTMAALRARYRQLQIRLEERQRRRHGYPAPGSSLGRIVEDEDADQQHNEQRHPTRNSHGSDIERRKRAFEELSTTSSAHHRQDHRDDLSSVSSTVSASLASWSPSRELEDEELIAVHVLGGSLTRSYSNQDLPPPAASEGKRQTEETTGAQQSRSSSTSSSPSADQSKDEQQQHETADGERRRMSDGDHKSDTDDSTQSDRMVL